MSPDAPSSSPPPTHLIIVCCHAIWLGGPTRGASQDEWLIAPFQHGETPTFTEHARAGVKCLAEHGEDAVLMFSGGPTKPETELSEAQSYANLAIAHNYWSLLDHNPSLASTRIHTEDRALDSYHNILFSLTLFHTLYSSSRQCWPTHLTIVSHAFKRPRLVEGHCAALGYPLERITYVGIDPPGMADAVAGGSVAGVNLAADEWAIDPHGRAAKLRGKREGRNPWGTWQGVFVKEEKNNADGEVDGYRGRLRTRGLGVEETVDEEAVKPWA